jgi:2-polyprenyl-3-methyl-5-hydroxy-6-metoxy-1,4-benzoquinol methylase
MTITNPIVPLEWTDELVSSIWEYYSLRPEAYFTHQFGDQILEETFRFAPKGAVVCDYGCGAGFLLRGLVERCKATGIDYTQANLTKSAEIIGNNKNLIGLHHISEAESLGETFDAIYFVETIEHLLDGHIEPTMKNLQHLLKPGGVIICTTPNDEDLREQEVFCPITRKTFHRYQHVRSFTKESLRNEFEHHGFEHVASFGTDFSARGFMSRLKMRLRELLTRKNPHLVCVVRRPLA